MWKNWRSYDAQHPIVTVAIWLAVASALIALIFDLHFYKPSISSAFFATEHYAFPLAISLLIAHVTRRRPKVAAVPIRHLRALSRQLLIVVSFGAIVYLHFVLKLWAQLVNPYRWDSAYQAIDEFLAPCIFWIGALHEPWQGMVSFWPLAYHDVFVSMFFASLIVHGFRTNRPEELTEVTTAVALVLAIGGLSYSVAPALGPFIFEQGTNPTAMAILEGMRRFYDGFTRSGGSSYSGEFFVAAVAAMPSLHIAHAFVLLYYAWTRIRWLGALYIPAFLFIVGEAISAKWHYLIDLPAGLLVAAISIAFASGMTRRYDSQRELSLKGHGYATE